MADPAGSQQPPGAPRNAALGRGEADPEVSPELLTEQQRLAPFVAASGELLLTY